MANEERGEVSVTVKRKVKREPDGELVPVDKTYTLKLSMNVAAKVEAQTKKKIGDHIALAGEMDFTAIRLLVWLLLQKYHAEEFKTIEQAGDFVDDAGGAKVFFDTLRKLQELNEAPAKPEAEGDGGAAPDALDPLDAAPAGTGPSSSSPAAVSA